MKYPAVFLAICLLSACASDIAPIVEAEEGYRPAIGSNEIFHEAISAASGHELIVADLLLPADAIGEAHSHLWEEYLYVIEGSAVLDIDEMDRRVLQAGEKFIIPAETVHTPTAGPEGIRAIIVRVHDEGDPLMIPASE